MQTNILSDVESVFATTAWTSNNIPAYPANYQGDKNNNEYVIVQVLPSSANQITYGGSTKRTSGLIAVKMFVKAGEGSKRLMQIAEVLDNVLQNKTLTNGTRTQASYLETEGLDPANSSLYSASYFIPFTYYGE